MVCSCLLVSTNGPQSAVFVSKFTLGYAFWSPQLHAGPMNNMINLGFLGCRTLHACMQVMIVDYDMLGFLGF